MNRMIIANPILPGFNPDPSIVLAHGVFYIATSTFQWSPGVQIHRSNDLINWDLAGRVLNENIDLSGVCDSGGIWAPCLTYSDGLFWLIYTNVLNHGGSEGIYKDTPNYLITSETIDGPWSEPVYLNSSGFDPSLFHDDDGKKYLVNQLWDHRPWKNNFAGILLQEFDAEKRVLTGNISNIFMGTELGCTEGPHLYKHEDYYYLLTAEGGTGFQHAVTICRSKCITGPYEVMPDNPLLTSENKADLRLQKAGHGDLVKDENNNWYLVHLCSRPSETGGFSTLGRETAIQRVNWIDQWPRLSSGKKTPENEIEIPIETSFIPLKEQETLDLSTAELPRELQFLRSPKKPFYNLTEKPNVLRLTGNESLQSWHNQSLLALRQDTPGFSLSVELNFKPQTFQQMAGLVAYYDTSNYYYLHLSYDEDLGKVLHLIKCCDGKSEYILSNRILPSRGAIILKSETTAGEINFTYEHSEQHKAGPPLSTSLLSDESGLPWKFTGSFHGIACQDLSGQNIKADFSHIEIKRRLI